MVLPALNSRWAQASVPTWLLPQLLLNAAISSSSRGGGGWVQNDEHWRQAGGASFTRKGKLFSEAALTAGSHGDAQLEFVGELILAVVTVNLAGLRRSVRRAQGRCVPTLIQHSVRGCPPPHKESCQSCAGRTPPRPHQCPPHTEYRNPPAEIRENNRRRQRTGSSQLPREV